MFHYPTPVVIRRVGPIEFEAKNTLDVLKVNAVLPLKVGDLGTVSASVNADGRLLVAFVSSSSDVLTATFIVSEYEMVASSEPEVEFVGVTRKKRYVPESDDEDAPKKKARQCLEEAEFDYDDTSSETALEGDSDFESDFDDEVADESEDDSDSSYHPPKRVHHTACKRVTRSKAKKVQKTKTIPNGMLWCSRLRSYLSKDSFSAKEQKNPNDKTRKSLRDAKHYTLKEKVELTGDEAEEGEPRIHTFRGRNRRTGGRYEVNQEADLRNTNVQYDDAVSGQRRLAAMVQRYVRD